MDKLEQLNDIYRTLVASGRVTSKKDFAEAIGVNYSGLVSAFGGNEKYLTNSLVAKAQRLVTAQPEENQTMFRVPLLPVEAHAGSLTEFSDAVQEYDCEMVVSPVRGASFAIQVTGESMAPAYPSGARILCQRIDEGAFVAWGNVYLLDTVNGAILKQVRKSDKPGFIVCHSLNPAPEFAPFEIEMRHINAWFRVLMIMSLV